MFFENLQIKSDINLVMISLKYRLYNIDHKQQYRSYYVVLLSKLLSTVELNPLLEKET